MSSGRPRRSSAAIFGQMCDPIRTLALEKSIPGPIFDMKRVGSWRASVVDLRSEEVSTRPLPLYVSPQFPMQAPTAQAWAGGEMPLRLLKSPGHGKLRIPRSIPLSGPGMQLVGDSHRRPPSRSTPPVAPEDGSNRRASLAQAIASRPEGLFLHLHSLLFPGVIHHGSRRTECKPFLGHQRVYTLGSAARIHSPPSRAPLPSTAAASAPARKFIETRGTKAQATVGVVGAIQRVVRHERVASSYSGKQGHCDRKSFCSGIFLQLYCTHLLC